MKNCILAFNSPLNGYLFSARFCKSITDAIKQAKEEKLPYRIIVDGKCIKKGWYK